MVAVQSADRLRISNASDGQTRGEEIVEFKQTEDDDVVVNKRDSMEGVNVKA